MRQLFFFILIFTATFVVAQDNNIGEQILKYEDSKSVILSKGRTFLTDRFLENDIEKVKEIRQYLTAEVEDKNYMALYPIENWLILYWTQEYEKLLNDITSFDSTRIADNQAKILPGKDMLILTLQEKSEAFADTIKNRIKNSNLSLEHEKFLLLNFEFLIMDAKADIYLIDTLNNHVDKFLEEYPAGEYNDFTRKYIRYKFVPKDWGVAFEFFSGLGLFTGTLSDNYTNNVPLGVAFDVCYKKFELYLRNYIGINKTKKDFNYSSGVFKKGSSTNVFLPEASLGYAVLDNDRFKISPFLGIGAMDISPTANATEKTPELKETSLEFTTTYMLGFNFDIKFGGKVPAFRPKTSYGFLRIRYAYTMPRFEKKYDGIAGNMHYITIGIGGFSRGIKRAL
jgi:hypothetical protein